MTTDDARPAPAPATGGPKPGPPEASLPALPLLAGASLPALVIGGGWALVGTLLERPAAVLVGLGGGAAVAVAGALSILLLAPWKRRSLGVLPFLWLAASGGRFVLTIAGGLLLYSSPALERTDHPTDLWFAILLAYVAVLFTETRVYAAAMRNATAPARGTGTA